MKEVIEISPWHTKWNLRRLCSIVFLLVLLYFLWIKQEIWLERLLTSNVRIRRSIVTTTETPLTLEDSSPKEDLIENSEEKDNMTDPIPINRSNSTSKKNSLLLPSPNSTIHYSTYEDLLELIRSNLKSRINERKFVDKLSKLTGLTRIQLNRFLNKKDFRLITFERFLIFLDSFDLMIFIVPKKYF